VVVEVSRPISAEGYACWRRAVRTWRLRVCLSARLPEERLDEYARDDHSIAWGVVRLAPGQRPRRRDVEIVVRLHAEKTFVVS